MSNQKSASDKEREQRSANEKAEREQRRANESAQRDERRRKEESSRNTKSVSSGPTKRQEAKAAAKEYDIDTKGLSTREINRAVSEQKEVEDDMVKFIEKTLDKFTAKKGDDVAPMDTPAAVTSRSTEVSAPPLRSSGSGGGQQRPQISDEKLLPFTIIANPSGYISLSKNSSVIDGVDGETIPIVVNASLPMAGTTRLYYLEAEIDQTGFRLKRQSKDGPPKPFTLLSTDAGNINTTGDNKFKEIVIDLKTGKQTYLRIPIALIERNYDYSSIVVQLATTGFIINVAFHNGIPVYVARPAPISPKIWSSLI